MNFLAKVEPPPGFFDDDLTQLGFFMNASRLWAYQPEWQEQIFDILGSIVREHGLTFRQHGIPVACASPLGDSCSSLAWGTILAPPPPTRPWQPPSPRRRRGPHSH